MQLIKGRVLTKYLCRNIHVICNYFGAFGNNNYVRCVRSQTNTHTQTNKHKQRYKCSFCCQRSSWFDNMNVPLYWIYIFLSALPTVQSRMLDYKYLCQQTFSKSSYTFHFLNDFANQSFLPPQRDQWQGSVNHTEMIIIVCLQRTCLIM